MEITAKRMHSQTEVLDGVFAPPPAKKIRLNLVGKALTASSKLLVLLEPYLTNVGNVSKAHSSCSPKLLSVLIKIADELKLAELSSEEIKELSRKLLLLLEHERNGDKIVRVKLFDLLAELLTEPVDINDLMRCTDSICAFLDGEKSGKVMSQGLKCLLKVHKQHEHLLHKKDLLKLAKFAHKQLFTSSYQTQKVALSIIAMFGTLNDSFISEYMQIIAKYVQSDDSGVRAVALRSLLQLGTKGVQMPTTLYSCAVTAMKDDYECVRNAALSLLYTVGTNHPDVIVTDGENEKRLIDAVFSRVCEALCDIMLPIRVQAANYLGGMTAVSLDYLHQTLDKKLMSNLRRKTTAHERGVEVASEWASGRRWASDNPKELLDEDSIALVSSGACGALVYGLEDEFVEVRAAAVESMCKLALKHKDFAIASLDFLVDMFNDEIEDVRLKAIFSLTSIAESIVLREDQLEIMLNSLEDYSVDVREGLHLMLGACRVASQAALLMVVEKVLDVLSKYPQDKKSAYRCMVKVGKKHPHLCLGLSSHLQRDHPYFSVTEREIDDPSYVCVLIMLYNAAEHLMPIIDLLTPQSIRHYAYVRDAMPELVPQLPIGGASTTISIAEEFTQTNSLKYLNTVLDHIHEVLSKVGDRVRLLKIAQENLRRLGHIDQNMSGIANFLVLFVSAQIQIEELRLCTKAQTLSRSLPVKPTLAELICNCRKLQHLFTGLTANDVLLVQELSLRVCMLNLVLTAGDSSQSALAPCTTLLQTAADLRAYLEIHPMLSLDPFTETLLVRLAGIEDPKPGRVCRDIKALVQDAPPLCMPTANLDISMCLAQIIEPYKPLTPDNAIKVTAGLIAALPFVAEIDNLQESQKPDMRIKIKYPDQQVHTVVPKMSDFKRTITEEGEQERSVRLRTTILLSHSVWTEAAIVEIRLCLFIRNGTDIELCPPAKVYFAPKPVRRGI